MRGHRPRPMPRPSTMTPDSRGRLICAPFESDGSGRFYLGVRYLTPDALWGGVHQAEFQVLEELGRQATPGFGSGGAGAGSGEKKS